MASMRRLLGSSPRKAAGAEECLYRLIADASSDWEYLDDPYGRMLWVSPSYEPITGHSPDKFLKDSGFVLAIVHPEDRALFESHRGECRLSDDREEAEFRIVRSDGGVCWIGHRCQPMSLPGEKSVGRPLAMLFVDLDHFKALNDEYSHEVGDKALRKVSQRIHDS